MSPTSTASSGLLIQRDDEALRQCLQGSDCVDSFEATERCYNDKIGTTPLNSATQAMALAYQDCVCNDQATNNADSFNGCINCLYGGNMSYNVLDFAENSVMDLCHNGTASQTNLIKWVASFIMFMNDIDKSFSMSSAVPSAVTITGDMASYSLPSSHASMVVTPTPTNRSTIARVSAPMTSVISGSYQTPPAVNISTASMLTSAPVCSMTNKGAEYTSVLFADGPTTVYVVMPSPPTQRASIGVPWGLVDGSLEFCSSLTDFLLGICAFGARTTFA
ncbi:hypothetical protein K490DRAFT_66726 [Saccharata proteae CBS 121410]|uniref:Uncharacterized protein n=1 Tax=Saccharata proteae CBS 121410 TaxID=1314787 RepID=A0A9P4LZ18_9PEZI|nr:hypothetical protein K490DRAFT_66726 [Saccharata proteae CBS 121410]